MRWFDQSFRHEKCTSGIQRAKLHATLASPLGCTIYSAVWKGSHRFEQNIEHVKLRFFFFSFYKAIVARLAERFVEKDTTLRRQSGFISLTCFVPHDRVAWAMRSITLLGFIVVPFAALVKRKTTGYRVQLFEGGVGAHKLAGVLIPRVGHWLSFSALQLTGTLSVHRPYLSGALMNNRHFLFAILPSLCLLQRWSDEPHTQLVTLPVHVNQLHLFAASVGQRFCLAGLKQYPVERIYTGLRCRAAEIESLLAPF